jgi:transposase IS116/IS110/IS902 family protein
MMHGPEKSDPAIVATKPTNDAGQSAEEPVERRAGTKGNADARNTRRTQGRERVSQELARVREAAKVRKRARFTALFHHIGIDLLESAFFELERDAAPGVDRLVWKDYEADLERKLEDLHDRVQRRAYRALPSRRVYIPKPDGRRRPLAVAALEDKIVQRGSIAVFRHHVLDRVPELARACLTALGAQLRMLKAQILEFDRHIMAWHRSNEMSKQLDEIPGVGPALATVLVAGVANPAAFRSARHFSAWVGLVPKQHSSEGKDKLGSISKQGDRYLRSLFTAGALAVIRTTAT